MLKNWNSYQTTTFKKVKKSSSKDHLIISSSLDQIKEESKKYLAPWQIDLIETKSVFQTSSRTIHLIHVTSTDAEEIRDSIGQKLVTLIDDAPLLSMTILDASLVQKIATIVEMAKYRFNELQKKLSIEVLGELNEAHFKKGRALGESINFSRFLVDVPSEHKTPLTFANFLKKIFSHSKEISAKHFGETELRKMGAGLLIGVGKGAQEKAQLLHFTYKNGAKKETTLFVGKGITFDAGGFDLKPSSAMRYMKKDMGGAASVLGVLYYLVQMKVKTYADFVIPLAENVIDGNSMRPGDILTSLSGKTVEIHNTDAEGRLALADALSYAQANVKGKIKYIIDVATLTGAIKAGLGSDVPGLFSNDPALSQTISKLSEEVGELVWPMPLLKKMRPKIKGSISDLVNCTDGFGGAITAALFLEEFIEQKISWAHLDIYSWVDSQVGPYKTKGGKGQLVELFSALLEN